MLEFNIAIMHFFHEAGVRQAGGCPHDFAISPFEFEPRTRKFMM